MREYSEGNVPDLDVDAIVEILEEAPVTLGVLFGSYARGDERATSDVDVAVELDPELSSMERTRARLSLIERLSVALGRDAVDVIPLSTAPEELRREIGDEGILLVGRTEDVPTNDESVARSRDNRERFDELIDDLERVV